MFRRIGQVTLVLSVLMVCGCSTSRLRRVSGTTFMRYGEEIGGMNSAYWVTYVGANHARAYMEFGRPSFPFAKREVWNVLWTPLSDLPPELAAQLREGADPWKVERDIVPDSAGGGNVRGQSDAGLSAAPGNVMPSPR